MYISEKQRSDKNALDPIWRFVKQPRFILIAGLLWITVGCRREEISVYRVPKGSEGLVPIATAPGQGDASGAIQLKYTTPAGWQENKAAGINVAQFSLPGGKGELTAMSFPGEGASQLNLINILRENAGLKPLGDQELSKLVEPVTVGTDKGSLIDFSGAVKSGTNISNGSITVAVVAHGGSTWFFKMAGDSAVVASQRPELLEFLKSVVFANAPATSTHGEIATDNSSATTLPAMGSDLPATNPTAGRPAWEVPAAWHEVPPTQMLLAKFVANDNAGEADVTVSSFPGDVGGTLANVNRWRGMVGLNAVGEDGLSKAVTPFDVSGANAILVDVSGQSPKTGKPTRLIGVIWPRNGQTWFYKLMGDSASVGSQSEAFQKFVHSVHYSND